MNLNRVITVLLFVLGPALARPNYVGYSGAPGTPGRCAGSCHGSTGGTVVVAGFPSVYEPGQSYEVKLTRTSGSSINNFNASVRIGTGSHTAGTITAGLNTSTYNTSQEPNGVHLSASNRDSCTFFWTAPDTGVGEVRLYLAAHQGTSAGGPNTELVLVATPATGAAEPGRTGRPRLSLKVIPTVSAGRTAFRVTTPSTPTVLRIISRSGRVLARFVLPDETTAVVWTPAEPNGKTLAPGVYFAVASTGPAFRVEKFTLLAR